MIRRAASIPVTPVAFGTCKYFRYAPCTNICAASPSRRAGSAKTRYVGFHARNNIVLLTHTNSQHKRARGSFFLKLLHLVGVYIESWVTVGIRGEIGFETQMTQKLMGVWQFLPYLGEERSATEAALDDDSVHTWAQPGDEVISVLVGEQLRAAEYRYLDTQIVNVLRVHGRKPRIVERCTHCVLAYI
jgi:hypothetical protein